MSPRACSVPGLCFRGRHDLSTMCMGRPRNPVAAPQGVTACLALSLQRGRKALYLSRCCWEGRGGEPRGRGGQARSPPASQWQFRAQVTARAQVPPVPGSSFASRLLGGGGQGRPCPGTGLQQPAGSTALTPSCIVRAPRLRTWPAKLSAHHRCQGRRGRVQCRVLALSQLLPPTPGSGKSPSCQQLLGLLAHAGHV